MKTFYGYLKLVNSTCVKRDTKRELIVIKSLLYILICFVFFSTCGEKKTNVIGG